MVFSSYQRDPQSDRPWPEGRWRYMIITGVVLLAALLHQIYFAGKRSANFTRQPPPAPLPSQ